MSRREYWSTSRPDTTTSATVESPRLKSNHGESNASETATISRCIPTPAPAPMRKCLAGPSSPLSTRRSDLVRTPANSWGGTVMISSMTLKVRRKGRLGATFSRPSLG